MYFWQSIGTKRMDFQKIYFYKFFMYKYCLKQFVILTLFDFLDLALSWNKNFSNPMTKSADIGKTLIFQ